jgi:hypothetical protein
MLSDLVIEIIQQVESDTNKPRRELFFMALYMIRDARSRRLPRKRRVAEKFSEVALSPRSVDKSQYRS